MNNKNEVLEKRAYSFAVRLQKRGKYPAAIIGAGKSYYKYVSRSGPISPHDIAVKLKNKLSSIGELYPKQNGNFVGCCAEVSAANLILLKRRDLNPNQVDFSNALRPITMQKIPRCKNCQITFN
ncbi:hypothetical protein R1T16_14630 [Flavobacterium sp. DG1-102-2]|uniref:hypothetical protein n=1 Tax=Flavobacterium sp. DG1-102-2 TaxID=3081663 RepID=UPI002949C4CC|nr:hypothetical protein [Flavobacterium sp. DG1-102-2]MDV6169670.1 hypothetical protein [Flavobacterium sp. DG1-102-2]